MEQKDIDNITNNFGKLGRLQFTAKCMKELTCKRCPIVINKGQPYWSQSNYIESEFFPIKDKICLNCGLNELAKGTQIKNLEKYDKWKGSQGCGKEIGLVKCGELNLYKKVMAYCEECSTKYKIKGVFNGK